MDPAASSASTPASDDLLPPPLHGLAPERLVLMLDCDGVLAPIVDDPAAAAVPPETVDLVQMAADRCALVAIVTGRGLERARELVPVEGAWYAALHGVHIVSPEGAVDSCAVSAAARPHVEAAATLAQTVGWAYEDKQGSVTVHFRQRGSLGQRVDPHHVRSQLQMVLDPTRVEIHDAKQVLEVRPKGSRTKGDAVRILSAAAPDVATTVVYVGDDLTDVDAFRAMDELSNAQLVETAAEPALRYVKVAVGGAEAPQPLVEAADHVLAGEDEVPRFLAGLIGA